MKRTLLRSINIGLVAAVGILLLVSPITETALAATGSEPSSVTLSTYWHKKILRWESLIIQAAHTRRLDPDFLASLVWMESRGDPYAVGPVGAIGLMQVMPKEAGFTWRPSRDVLVDPSINLFWGSRTLATVITQGHGDVFNALAAYNGGWDQIMYRGPTIFATSILRDYANAVAARYSIKGSWVAFFARSDVGIRGPVWVAESERKDVYYFGSENVLPDGMPLIPDVTPSSVIAYSLDDKRGEAFITGVWLYDVDSDEWINSPSPEISTFFLESVEVVNKVPEPTPTPQVKSNIVNVVSQQPAVTPTPEPTIACAGGDFWAEGWQLESVVNAKGWTVTIYAEGHGGDCQFTYAWDIAEDIKAHNVNGPVIFNIYTPNRDANIVGTVLVTSGDEVSKIGIYVPSPGK